MFRCIRYSIMFAQHVLASVWLDRHCRSHNIAAECRVWSRDPGAGAEWEGMVMVVDGDSAFMKGVRSSSPGLEAVREARGSMVSVDDEGESLSLGWRLVG